MDPLPESRRIGIGLYGGNGHVPLSDLAGHPRGRVVAIAGLAVDSATLPEARRLGGLDELLAEPDVDLVVLCSRRRDAQEADALRCLEAGRHVLAEKPAALDEDGLDRLIAACRRTRRLFREMSGSGHAGPWPHLGRLIAAGRIGTPIQVCARKSYPMADWRPADEGVDGGIIRQAAVHGLRWIEHGLGLAIEDADAIRTRVGCPAPGGPYTAAILTLRLAGGAVGTLAANYANPLGLGSWGDDALRVYGTTGMIEVADNGARWRLVDADRNHGWRPTCADEDRSWLDRLIDEILDGTPFPCSLEDDLHPTRIALRAAATARNT